MRKYETIVILAGGASLTKQDVEYVEKCNTNIMGINDAYRICNRLDYLYGCDRKWWNWHWARVNELPCLKFALEDVDGRQGIIQMKNGGISGLSFEWPKLRTGKNSGHQAINLAILLKYKKIILLGYDMQYTQGKAHWFGSHEKPLHNPPVAKLKEWIGFYNKMAEVVPKDISIINATRQTALSCFKRMKLEDALH
jgi:hypothetical protein